MIIDADAFAGCPSPAAHARLPAAASWRPALPLAAGFGARKERRTFGSPKRAASAIARGCRVVLREVRSGSAKGSKAAAGGLSRWRRGGGQAGRACWRQA
eukprot:tig00000489_g1366.t1